MGEHPTLSVGDKIDVWFDGGRVISVAPYRGRYHEAFTYVVRVTAPNTHRGWIEIAV